MAAQNDSRACASCRYHVTLLASARVNLTIVASTAAAHTLLVEGAAVYGQVARGEYARFKTYGNRAAAHNLVVTVRERAGRAARACRVAPPVTIPARRAHPAR
jgi:hypothetical protein